MKVQSELQGWRRKTLRDLVTISYGKSPKGILSADGLYPVVGTGGTVRFGDRYLYDGDSIILGRKGTIDRILYMTGRFWTIDTAYYLSNFIDTNPRWLFYLLQSLDLRQLNEATGVPSLSRNALYNIRIEAPPKTEQYKIAGILSTVDRAINQTEALIAKQQRIKTGLVQDLLTRGIDRHGTLRSEDTHSFKESPVGRIPVEWDAGELFDLVDEPITYGIVQAGPHIDDGIPYIRTGDMGGDTIQVSQLLRTSSQIANAYKRSAIHPGDIIFALRATVGKVLPVTEELSGANLTQGTAKISPKDSIDSTFLLWAMRTSRVQNTIRLEQKGTTFTEITLGDLRRIKLAFPIEKYEQSLIGERLELHDRLRRDTLEQKRKLQSIRTAIMQDLLTGVVSVAPLLTEAEAGV